MNRKQKKEDGVLERVFGLREDAAFDGVEYQCDLRKEWEESLDNKLDDKCDDE